MKLGCLRNKNDFDYQDYKNFVAKTFEKMIVRYTGYFKEIIFCYSADLAYSLEIFQQIFGSKKEKKVFTLLKDNTIKVFFSISQIFFIKRLKELNFLCK